MGNKIEMELMSDGQLAIGFTDRPGPPYITAFTTGALDEHIQYLRSCRICMSPAFPMIWEQGQRPKNYGANPQWFLENTALAGDVILHLRDGGFGWLHYTLGTAEARELGKALIAHADEPRPETAGSA